MIKCSFCEATTEELQEGWGRVIWKTYQVVFCPEHRGYAEIELDRVFEKI